MLGVYSCSAKFSLSTAKSLILIEAPSTRSLELLSAKVTNATVETNEQLEIALTRVTTKGAPAGTTGNALKLASLSPNSGATLLTNLTTEPTTYDANGHLDYEGVASLSGYVWTPIPEARIEVPPSGLVGLRSLAAATAFDVVCQIVWREIG